MIDESRTHSIARVLQTAPGLGPIRVACLLPIVVTPHRFRTRRQFWSYCGLGIVMRSSSDWIRTENGGWAPIVLRMWKDGKEYDPKTIQAAATEDLASPPD